MWQQGRVNQRWDTGQQRARIAASSTHGYLTGGLKLENSICEATALMTAVPGAGIGSSRDILKQDFHFRHLARRGDLGTARCLWHTRSITSRDCILCPHNLIQYSGLTRYFSYVAFCHSSDLQYPHAICLSTVSISLRVPALNIIWLHLEFLSVCN